MSLAPEARRDLLIVLGLIGLGLLFNLLVGVAVVLLFEAFGVWDALSLEAAITLHGGHAGTAR